MRSKILPYLALAILLAVFTFTFGVAYFPTLDADNAIQVIMIDHLRFPSDLYYMGQDRIGSIVPSIGWVFYQLGAAPIWAVTFTQLLIFTVSGLILLHLFHNRLLACASVVILLFPLSEFESQVLSGHPYLGHVIILFLAIWSFKKFGLSNPVVFLFAGVGVWASGIFAANVAAAGAIYLFSRHLTPGQKNWWLFALKAALWALPGLALLLIAKGTATTTDNNYTQSSFVSWPELGENLKLLGNHLGQYLSFSHPDVWMCLSLWLLLSILCVSLPVIFKEKITSWSWFFILSGLITVLAILLSEWAFRMGLPLRYFSIAYIQILWGAMLAWDRQPSLAILHKVLSVVFVVNALLIGVSGLAAQGKFWRKVPGRLYADTAKELSEKIETEGILGSYWYVYLTEAFDPVNLTSLVHEYEINRDFDAMARFLELDTVTIIKNSFVPELTPTIYDHGVYYHKAGPIQKIEQVEFAKYHRPADFEQQYSFGELRTNYGTVDTLGGDSALMITSKNFDGNNFAVYGPYVTLAAGHYKACFKLQVQGDIGPEAFVDVQKRMAPVKKAHLLDTGSNPCIEFDLQQPEVDVEFRVGYYGRGELIFKGVEIQKLD